MKSLFCKTLLALVPAGLLVGCMVPPQPSLDRHTPAHWQQAESAMTDARAVDASALSSWWKLLGDPMLDALVEQALAQNLDLGQALDKLQAQRVLLASSSAAFSPQIGVHARSLQDVSAMDSYFHTSVELSWNPGLFGLHASSVLDGQASLLAAQAQWQAVRVQLVASVVQRYLEIGVAQQQRSRLEQQMQLEARELQLLQLRVAQHIGSSLAVQEATLELARSRSQHASLQHHQARAAHALAALLGRSTPEAAWLSTSNAALRPHAAALHLQVLPAELLRQRPAILAAEADVQRAAAAAGLSQAALYPRFALGGSLLYSYNLTQNRRSGSDHIPMLGPVIDIPLLDWGQRRAQADAADLALSHAIKAYRQSVLDGLAEVEGALAGLAAQHQRLQSLQAQTPVLHSRSQQLQRRQQLGLASELDTLAPRRQLLQHQRQQDVAQAAHTLAYAALFQALGGAAMPPQTAAGATGAAP